jgi:hypothetical protein
MKNDNLITRFFNIALRQSLSELGFEDVRFRNFKYGIERRDQDCHEGNCRQVE